MPLAQAGLLPSWETAHAASCAGKWDQAAGDMGSVLMPCMAGYGEDNLEPVALDVCSLIEFGVKHHYCRVK